MILHVILPVFLSLSAGSASSEAASHRSRLAKLKGELMEQRQELKGLTMGARGTVLSISALDRAFYAFRRQVKKANEAVVDLTARQEKLTNEYLVLRSEVFETETLLYQRLRRIYTDGEGDAVRHLLGASSYEDHALRARALRESAQLDAELFAELAEKRDALATKKYEVDHAKKSAEELLAALEQQQSIVEETRNERAAFMAKLERKKEAKYRVVQEIVAAQRAAQTKLAGVLRKLPPRKRRTTGILRNGFRRPAAGVIFRDFGTRRDPNSGAKITSNGIHIRADYSDKVLSPAVGTVAFTGWMRGFGQIVIVDIGESTHVLLAHLSEISVKQGDNVERGQAVGEVGDSDSLEGTKLYFEVRRRSRPINPVRYLRQQ